MNHAVQSRTNGGPTLDRYVRRALCVLGVVLLGARFPIAWGAQDPLPDRPRPEARTEPRPDILLILADDMGFSDLGCYGGEIPTPHLDRIAERGRRMRHFYNNGKCSPTRASLHTGRYSQSVNVHAGPTRIENALTVAEVLGASGYRTLMTGKWHTAELPTDRGFDRYFGLADGCCNFFNPGQRRDGEPEPGRKRPVRRWSIDGEVFEPWTPEDPDFYSTDAFTDVALGYLDEYGEDEAPLFLHVAYTAPHYPLHARPEDIERHRGRYLGGWDVVREQRRARQVEMGLIEEATWPDAGRDPGVPAWESIEDREAWDLKMAVYAAMIDRMDANIGRLLEKLDELGRLDNTLVIFLSDNGGCAETVHRTPDIPPGPLASYRTVDPPWANASNTPFRKYKSWNHEGGIATSCVVQWPARLEAGDWDDTLGHVIDLMPTLCEAAGVAYPREWMGAPAPEVHGVSLLGAWVGENDAVEANGRRTIVWQFQRHGALRQGPWKLLGPGGDWELYNLAEDRTETRNLAGEHPERLDRMVAEYRKWARRVGANPFEDR